MKSWEILSKVYGETEARLKQCFEDALVNSPSIILIDQVDTFSLSNNPTDLERRIINTMQSLFDMLKITKHNGVAILGTTRNLELVDGNLRRPGRYQCIIHIYYVMLLI